MKAVEKKIVIAGGLRTPIGHFARSLAGFQPDELLASVLQKTLDRAGLRKDQVDGVVAGWVGQTFSAPNIARVAALKAGLPVRTQTVTVQNNCVSSIESIAAAARFILAGEGELYLAGGVEVMSRLPYSIDGSRAAKELRGIDTVKAKWAELPASPNVSIADSLEVGLTDPVEGINMAGTAEVCAQMLGIGRKEQDDYARESLRRALEAWKKGFYASHVVPVEWEGQPVLKQDEYAHLRVSAAENEKLFAKAPLMFDGPSYSIKDFYREFGRHIEGKEYSEGTQGTVTLFNSCPRSDGAAVVIVTTEERAKALGLEVLAELKSWAFEGTKPAHMDIAPAFAAAAALERANVKFENLDQIELHEPFAASALAIFRVGHDRFGHDWAAKNASGALNPNGGSIALGHPLGATGVRLMLNLVNALRANPKGHLGMLAACASGGVGGAIVVER